MKSIEDINFMNKEDLVEEFSIRWHYALPPRWPPENFDYQ